MQFMPGVVHFRLSFLYRYLFDLYNMDMSFISFQNVTKVYHQGEVDIHALSGVDFDVEKGQIVIVAGASGAGKSTVLNILGGMDSPTSGEITVDGVRHERDGIACLVANTATMQGEIEIVSDCSMSDGLIDVIVLATSDAVQLIVPFLSGILDRRGRAGRSPAPLTGKAGKSPARQSPPCPTSRRAFWRKTTSGIS